MISRDFLALIQPSELPNNWVAVCLELSLVGDGRSIQAAFDCLCEMVVIAMTDDLKGGSDPMERPRCDDEDWQELNRILQGVLESHRAGTAVQQKRAVGFLRVAYSPEAANVTLVSQFVLE